VQDNILQFVNQTQEVNRCVYDAIEAGARTHFKTMQRLADVQRDVFNQAFGAAGDQLQLVSQFRDPREFASAQANLIKGYGQMYVDCVNEAVDIVSEAWDEYGDQLEQSIHTARDKAQQATHAATQAIKEATNTATESTKRAASSKKS
jgi:hypothetical protein